VGCGQQIHARLPFPAGKDNSTQIRYKTYTKRYTQYEHTMKHLYIIFLISFFPIFSFGQSEYFLTDSLTSVGIKLIDGGDLINSRLCQVKKGKKTIEYTPYEVKEFGFKDGRVYVSKEIHIADSLKRVFLERLHKGETNLYYYKGKGIKTFFIQKDSTLFVEVPKRNTAEEDFSKQLLNLTKDCPNVKDACKLVSYNKKSLSKLMARYNQCELEPFPHFRFGLLISYEFSKLIPSEEKNEDFEYFDYNYDGSFSIGLFIDNPILASDFSIHTELLYSKHRYLYNKFINNNDIDFVANFSSINVPLLLRYEYPSNKIRPYINIGVVGTYHVKNETLLRKTNINETTIEINDAEITSMINNIQLGYAIGGGLEYKLNYKNSLFFELRYNNQYNQGGYEFLGTSVFNMITGMNF
jgi:hypothetical protein